MQASKFQKKVCPKLSVSSKYAYLAYYNSIVIVLQVIQWKLLEILLEPAKVDGCKPSFKEKLRF
jgi:hypothetical protein